MFIRTTDITNIKLDKKTTIFLSLFFLSIILISIYFLFSTSDREIEKDPMSIISNFIKTDDFNYLFVGELAFENKEISQYSKEFKAESNSPIDEIIAWGKQKAFSVNAELHLVVKSSFLVDNSQFKVTEKDDHYLVILMRPKISSLEVDYAKTVVDFKEVGALADENDREFFLIKEVFNKNLELYTENAISKNMKNVENKARRIIRRSLLELINLDKIIEVEFRDSISSSQQ